MLSADRAPWPGVAEPLPPDTTDHLASPPKAALDPEVVIRELREQLASGKHDVDAILGAIAIAAQAITDASGAALGMRRDGVVTCVGRSGESAPALGARLSAESGISGECLRSGRALRCDDAEKDPRVDSEVCRHLGLRSIAAVPVRSRLETVGILEVFSPVDGAFTDGDLAWLGNLAELADAAASQAAAVAEALAVTAPTVRPTPVLAAEPKSGRNGWRVPAIAGGVVILGLLASATWKILHEDTPPSASRPASAQTPAPQVVADSPPNPRDPAAKPSLERLTADAENNSTQGRLVPASRNEKEDVTVRTIVNVPPPKTPDTQDAAQAPEVVVVSDAGIPDLALSSDVLPKLGPRVSQGVTPLELQSKVLPRYPATARAMGIQGKVILVAKVSEQGKVEEVKAVSGHPVLISAAVEAVKQWRYRPAMLNGKPVRIETNLTVTFKLP